MSAAIPPEQPQTPETVFARLQAWYVTQQELAALKVREIIERKELAAYYFAAPREGSNRMEVSPGFDLKLEHGYNYKVDVAALDNVTQAQIKKLKLPWDDLFVYKPELCVREYRKLSTEQKAFVDTLLDITPSTPSLAIVPQAERRQTMDELAAEGAFANPPTTPGGPDRATVQVSAQVEGPHIVDDMDDAVVGSYYEDGDGQWWHVTGQDGDELVWDTCDNPNSPAPEAKPKRTRKKKD